MAYKGKMAGLISRPGYNSALKKVVPPSKLPGNQKFLSSEADQPVRNPIPEPLTSAINWLTPTVKSQLKEQDVTLKYNLNPEEKAIRADVYKFEPSELKNVFQKEKNSLQEWFWICFSGKENPKQRIYGILNRFGHKIIYGHCRYAMSRKRAIKPQYPSAKLYT